MSWVAPESTCWANMAPGPLKMRDEKLTQLSSGLTFLPESSFVTGDGGENGG